MMSPLRRGPEEGRIFPLLFVPLRRVTRRRTLRGFRPYFKHVLLPCKTNKFTNYYQLMVPFDTALLVGQVQLSYCSGLLSTHSDSETKTVSPSPIPDALMHRTTRDRLPVGHLLQGLQSPTNQLKRLLVISY